MTMFPNSGAYRTGLTSHYGSQYSDSLEHSINYASNTKHEDNIFALVLTAHIASKGGGTTVVDFELSALDFGALAHLMMATDPKRARAAFDESRRRKPKP